MFHTSLADKAIQASPTINTFQTMINYQISYDYQHKPQYQGFIHLKWVGDCSVNYVIKL